MEELNHWLDEYRSEKRLSPASWAELPEDLKLNLDNLARESLFSTALAFAVTSVPGTAACFFMCHDLTSIK